MYCPNCSENYQMGEGFCSKCGWRLGGKGESKPHKKRRSPFLKRGDFFSTHWDFVHAHADQRPFVGGGGGV